MPYRSVTPQKAAALATGGAVLLDVREPAEWQAGHSPQACHTPLGQLADISVDRLVVTVCRPGAPHGRPPLSCGTTSANDHAPLRSGSRADPEHLR
jgi:rhodanese-related sulfurtransferase